MKRDKNARSFHRASRNSIVRKVTSWTLLGLTAASICLAHIGTVHAVTTVWTGPATGGDFQTPANWSTAAVPTTLDLALFGGVNGSITYTADAATDQTFFTGANAATTLALGPSQTHSTLRLMIVGSGAVNQDLVVPSGTVNTGTILIIGSGVGADNSDVTVSGPNTVFDTGKAAASASVFLGTGGLAPTLTIKEGATYKYSGATNGLVGVGLQQTSNAVLTLTDPG